ncbi:MAG: Na+/H+ antiporter NhaC [Gammaproteobacteria bacterium]|nr:Na+/H+ antiporter NhaC [Gammaproteobacteria bacterium]
MTSCLPCTAARTPIVTADTPPDPPTRDPRERAAESVIAPDATPPLLIEALLPVALLVSMLAASVAIFGEDASYGPNQIALLLAAAFAGLVGMRRGVRWPALQEGIVQSITIALPAMLILLMVGALIGAWILSGTVPYLILLSTHLLSPQWFYPAVCLICALVSVSIGSSWTTAGTIGVALVGAGQAMELSPAVTAGAVISGAYFGDKMSPLSDTTNLAAAVSRVDLFEHIRNMVWTAGPAMVVALLLFTFLGRGSADSESTLMQLLEAELAAEFHLGLVTLLPLAVLVVLSARRYPPLPVLALGAVIGAVLAVLLQRDAAMALAPEGMTGVAAAFTGAWIALFDGYESSSSAVEITSLLDRGGMSSMLNTIWLIMTAMVFGGVMERTGLLHRLVEALLVFVRGSASLIMTTLSTSFLANVLAADQYMAIAVPGRLFEKAYGDRGLSRLNLSRSLEDGGTLTSVMIPWNTCGAYMAATLGVATFSYLPFLFFNLAAVGFAILWATLGVGLIRDDRDHSDVVRA